MTETPTPTVKDKNLRFLLMKTLADYAKTETDAARAELLPVLLEQYKATGTKSFTVHIPGAEKVATFTLAEPKPGHQVDEAALLQWCEWHR
ncbi:MAG TPA: hypothetical protein VF885_16120, partial [Arthrobacter sp.]